MKNRQLFQRDPAVSKLMNDGVAAVREAASAKEIETLRYELEHFVCEGQYEDGLIRILESYLGNASSTTQPAAWVSGFYGSGKSHLLKMFRHLWVDTRFDDGTTARGLARLPQEVQDLLRELDTLGKRSGGLHAASGTLPSGGGESVRLAVLSIVLASKGLPEALPQAMFCMWLQKNGTFKKVKAAVKAAGKDFYSELHDLYVSPILAKAVLDADPDFATDLKQARAALRAQFPVVEDISTNEFIRLVREVLSVDSPRARTAAPALESLLDETGLVAFTAAEALGHIGPEAKAAIPALQKGLKNEDVYLRMNAALALWRIDGRKDEALSVLLEVLGDKNWGNRSTAATRLGQMGPAAKEAMPPLAKALNDPELPVRILAALALWRIDGGHRETAIPVLREGLKDTGCQSQAIDALAVIGPEAKAAAPALIKLLETELDDYQRESTIKALQKIDPDAPAKADQR